MYMQIKKEIPCLWAVCAQLNMIKVPLSDKMGLIFGWSADFNSESFFNNHISNACLSQILLLFGKCDNFKMLAKLPNTNKIFYNCPLVVVVQMLSPVRFFATP